MAPPVEEPVQLAELRRVGILGPVAVLEEREQPLASLSDPRGPVVVTAPLIQATRTFRTGRRYKNFLALSPCGGKPDRLGREPESFSIEIGDTRVVFALRDLPRRTRSQRAQDATS